MILCKASVSVRTFCCIRVASKQFRKVVDVSVSYPLLLATITRNGTKQIESVNSMSKKVQNLYADTYPRLLINSFFSYIGYRNTIAVRDLIVDKLKDSEQF